MLSCLTGLLVTVIVFGIFASLELYRRWLDNRGI